jgi:hypothetical protein
MSQMPNVSKDSASKVEQDGPPEDHTGSRAGDDENNAADAGAY